ncbi:MAG: hypothetical protein ACM359_20270 [Bacillota bacterium]
MLRRRFAILSTLSLLLCIATTVAWIRSYSYGYMLLRGGIDSTLEISTGSGYLTCDYVRHPKNFVTHQPPPGHWRLLDWYPASSPGANIPPAFAWKLLGFFWCLHHPNPALHQFWYFGIPLWFPCSVTALGSIPTLLAIRRAILASVHWLWTLPFKTINSRIRLRRIQQGLCLHCGYDLRASTDRCPECGSPIPNTAPAPSLQATTCSTGVSPVRASSVCIGTPFVARTRRGMGGPPM